MRLGGAGEAAGQSGGVWACAATLPAFEEGARSNLPTAVP